jgi:hypothetical protein
VFAIEPCGNLAFRVANGETSWYIAFGDGGHTSSGEFEFDGEALCARFDAGTLSDLFGAKASMIRYQGTLLLDSVQRVKVDSNGGFHVQA